MRKRGNVWRRGCGLRVPSATATRNSYRIYKQSQCALRQGGRRGAVD